MASVEVSLKEMMTAVEGSVGAAVVDYTSGMALGTLGGGKDLDLTIAAAGTTDVIRAMVRTDRGHPDHAGEAVPPDPADHRAHGERAVPVPRARQGALQPGDGPPPAQAGRGTAGDLDRAEVPGRRAPMM